MRCVKGEGMRCEGRGDEGVKGKGMRCVKGEGMRWCEERGDEVV